MTEARVHMMCGSNVLFTLGLDLLLTHKHSHLIVPVDKITFVQKILYYYYILYKYLFPKR